MGAGRPRKYSNPKELQSIVDKYFNDCNGEILTDKDGQVLLDKYSKPIRINEKPLTMTGLALAVGFNSRTTFMEYIGRGYEDGCTVEEKEITDILTHAKAIVENYAETRLFDKDGSNGAKFWLASNGKGWTDKQDVSISNGTITVQLSEEE